MLDGRVIPREMLFICSVIITESHAGYNCLDNDSVKVDVIESSDFLCPRVKMEKLALLIFILSSTLTAGTHNPGETIKVHYSCIDHLYSLQQ